MDLNQIVATPKTIAIVGLSDKPERPSYQVARYLMEQGFTIIPINPMITGVFGIKAYPSISALPQDISVDIVDIFRKPEEVPAIVKEVLSTGRRPVIWMQEGVSSPEAKNLAEAQGLSVIMNMCMMKVHQQNSKQITH
jgi:predicted CoA-binding protein